MRSKILAAILSLIIVSAGCSFMSASKELGRRFLGISTEELRLRRGKGVKKVFDKDFYSCFNKAKAVVKEVDGYIYAADEVKEIIAFYRTERDTTPVGVFFRLIDMTHTEVEVVSPSSFIALEVAEKIFLGLEGKPIPKTKIKTIQGGDEYSDDEYEYDKPLDDSSREDHDFKPISRSR